MTKGRPHANMWRSQGSLNPGAWFPGVRAKPGFTFSGTQNINTPKAQTALTERRYGHRADKLLRRFSWEAGE